MTENMHARMTELLAREASLLDRREFKAWLTLYTEDALYWVPGWSDEPDAGIAIIYDDRERMEERVFRLTDTSAYAQMPPSHTVHVLSPVSNVAEVLPGTIYSAEYTMSVAEMRPGDHSQVGLADQRAFYARCEVEFQKQPDGQLLIRRKVIKLLDREQPIYNLTFIL